MSAISLGPLELLPTLALPMAFAWGRRNVSNLYWYLDDEHHRTRFSSFILVE